MLHCTLREFVSLGKGTSLHPAYVQHTLLQENLWLEFVPLGKGNCWTALVSNLLMYNIPHCKRIYDWNSCHWATTSLELHYSYPAYVLHTLLQVQENLRYTLTRVTSGSNQMNSSTVAFCMERLHIFSIFNFDFLIFLTLPPAVFSLPFFFICICIK